MRRKKHAGGTDRPKHGRPVHGEDPTGLNPHQIHGSVCDDKVIESLKPQSKELNHFQIVIGLVNCYSILRSKVLFKQLFGGGMKYKAE